MSRYIGDVRQSVRFAVSDLKDDAAELPGFSLPKKVCSVTAFIAHFTSHCLHLLDTVCQLYTWLCVYPPPSPLCRPTLSPRKLSLFSPYPHNFSCASVFVHSRS